MKKTILTLSAIAFAFVACNKASVELEPVAPEVVEQNGAVLSFTSDRPQTETDTKTAWDSANSAIVWTTGDRIKVGYTLDGVWMAKDAAADFVSDPKVPAKFYVSNNVTIDGTHANQGTFTVPSGFTNSPSGEAIFYGVYPQSCTDNDSNYAPSLTVNIKPCQTPGANTFDKDADIMVGHTAAQTLTGTFPGSALAMEWNRIVAHADLTFKNLGIVDDTSVEKITLTFNSEAKVVGDVYVDVTDGTVTTNARTLNKLEIKGTNLSFDGTNIEAWACVLPSTFTSVEVKVRTDKATYTRSITDISKTFKKNAHNTLGINMASATRVVNTTVLDDGNYVLVAKSGDDYFAISSDDNTGSSNRRDRVKITTEGFDPANYSDLSPYTADNSLIWTITNVTGGVKINLAGDANGYMGYTANKLPLNDTGVVFEVSEGTDTYTFEYTDQTRYISMNDTFGFGCYVDDDTKYVKDIYVIPATGTPTMSFATTTKTVAADYASVDFAFAPLFLTDTPSVSVTTDAGSMVASKVVNSGSITVNLNENTTAFAKSATLTVSATGATPVVLTINQAAKMENASTNDVLWAEGFSGFSNNAIPTASNASTTIYTGGVSVTYACTGEGTKVYSGTMCGGTTPEFIIASGGGSFSAISVPTGNVTGMTLTFKSNNGCTVSTNTTGATVGSNLGTATACTYAVTVTSGTKRVNLIFTNSDPSNNTRIDDISLVAGAPVPGITVATNAATGTTSAEGTSATLNGTITLVNGATIGNVTEAGFYYKLTSAGSYTKVPLESSPATTTFSKDLTGLTMGSGYTYYAYAIYNGGSEVNGETASFTPSQSGGSPTLQTLYLEEFGDNGGNNTAVASATSYTATTSMFTDPTNSVVSHYTSDGKVGKNNVNVSNYSGASGKSAVWHTINGSANLFTVDKIDISSATGLSISFGAWYPSVAKGNSASLTVYYKIDDGAEQTLSFSGAPSNSDSWGKCSGTISGTGNSLKIRFVMNTSKSYTIRVDDIKVVGTK